jgi:hypothetical protein
MRSNPATHGSPASSSGSRLFDIASLVHGSFGRGLTTFQGLIDRHLASKSARDVLANYRGD